MDIKVSVIVPIYKVEKYLEKCILSLTNQTYQNLEIILVDDGSPDNCPLICDEYAKKDSRVKVIHKSNGGVMSAWIEGFKHSRGKFVTFLDGDDTFQENAIEVMINNMQDADLCICGYQLVFENSNMVSIQTAVKSGEEGVFEGQLLENFKKYNILQPNSYMQFLKCNKLFKREIIANNLKYCDMRVSWGDDCCIVMAAILDSNKIVVTNNITLNYLQRQTSIVHTYNHKMLENCEILNEMYNGMLKKKGVYLEEGAVFERVRLLYALTQNIINSTLSRAEKKQKFKELQLSKITTYLVNSKETNKIKRTYKIFYKIFKTKNYLLNKIFIKLVNRFYK